MNAARQASTLESHQSLQQKSGITFTFYILWIVEGFVVFCLVLSLKKEYYCENNQYLDIFSLVKRMLSLVLWNSPQGLSMDAWIRKFQSNMCKRDIKLCHPPVYKNAQIRRVKKKKELNSGTRKRNLYAPKMLPSDIHCMNAI